MVHRDVKAENILIDRRSARAVVTDFGIARLAEASPLTATGLVLGSVYYMSPEQIAGEPVDGRSDIYSLGIVAFHALSGRFPFDSETASAVLVAHVTRPAPSLTSVAPTLPADLAAFVDRCLAKDPAARFASCAALEAALMEIGSLDRGAVVRRPSATDGVRADRLVSETEAQAVWNRAAQLQVQPDAPARPPARDDHRAAVSRSSAYSVDVVRDSAREAGIPTGVVDRALLEHGLAGAMETVDAGRGLREPTGQSFSTGVRDLSVERRSPWTGERSDIDYELIIDDEMPERDFDWLVETIRRALGDVGVISTVGRSLSWVSADPKRKVHISVQVRSGRTTIRVGERLGALRGELFGGIMGGFGGGFGTASIAIVMGATHIGPLALATGASIFGGSYLASRLAYGRAVRDRDRALRALIDRMSEDVRVSIAERDRSATAGIIGKPPAR